MRITNSTMVETFLNDLNTNLANMEKAQNQLASGKNISKPSDDPYGAVRQMQLSNEVDRNNQYLSNIQDSAEWIDTTDTALGQVSDALGRIRQLMISSANSAKTQSDIDANKAEILQQIEQIAQAGNTQFDGKYVFSGKDVTEKPFSSDGNGNISLNVSGDGVINREISSGVVIGINVTANEILKGNGTPGTDLASTLTKVVTALNNGDMDSLGGDLLGQISDNIDNITRCRGEVGAKENRMDSAKSKNKDETLNLTTVLSGISDVDVSQKIMEFNEMQSAYDASLMTGARILQKSLIDFLE